jgi:hypothetical protein
MKELVAQLIIFGYDVFLPVESDSSELVISCAMFTKRCLYRPSKMSAQKGCIVTFDTLKFANSTHIIDSVVTFNKLHGVIWLLPIEDVADNRMLCLNGKSHYELAPLCDMPSTSEINKDLIKTERIMADEGAKERDFFNKLLKGK